MVVDTSNNLLLALHRYASHQDENFTTEAFAHLLRHLRDDEPASALDVLSVITRSCIDWNDTDCRELVISTQEKIIEGTPDIVLVGPRAKVIVEVKVESEPSPGQLERYREHLGRIPVQRRCLTLLTKKAVDRVEVRGLVDCVVRWHEIGHSLNVALQAMKDETSLYLTKQFLGLLAAGGMTMERISWELIQGVRSLSNLLEMLCNSIQQQCTKQKSFAGTTKYAFQYFTVGDTECGAGLYYSRPAAILFEAYNVDRSRAQAVDLGSLQERKKDEFTWVNEFDLEREDVHYFALSLASQMDALNEFVEKSIQAVRRLTPTP